MERFHLIYHGRKKSQVGLTQKKKRGILAKISGKIALFFARILDKWQKDGHNINRVCAVF